MLKPADRSTVGTVIAFPNGADSQRNGRLNSRALRLIELEAENAKLRKTAIALLLAIDDLREGRSMDAADPPCILIARQEIPVLARRRRLASRQSWRRTR